MDVVEVYVGEDEKRFGETRFGMASSAPRIYAGRLNDPPPPPITLMSMEDLVEALQPDGADWFGAVGTVTRDGFLRVECANGCWIYEVFAARWSDGEGGPFYLAVWRD
ncbi:hypothetical protein A5722_14695 [Mycobacterium vulneris]|nr:hypothetical protein A5722_14695 [Mycolicibacterium vulneris]OCB66177.1 hypothetical protein A5729_12200 [Mycolicibacterium vulneris]